MSRRRTPTLESPRVARRTEIGVPRRSSVAAPAHAPDVTGRIRAACDAVVEACCLVAVLSLPLYFSVLTSTSFEPDKAALLRVFAAIAGGAWLLGCILDPGRRPARRGLDLLLAVGVVYFLTYALATLLSVDPRLSLWGLRLREDGLVTRLALLIFFVAAATRLRTSAQWNRLITLLVFGSVPVVIYGLAQQLGLDPIPQSGDPATVEWPVRSSLGQHIFLGSYLVLVMPFAAARALEHWDWRAARVARGQGDEVLMTAMATALAVGAYMIYITAGSHRPQLFALFPALLAGCVLLGLIVHELPDSPVVRRARAAGYLALLFLQVMTLVLSGARAAVIASIAAAVVFAFLLAQRLRRPRLTRGILALVAAVSLFLVLLNIPNGPLQPLRTVHGLNRLADITDAGGSTGSGQGRLLVWRGITTLLMRDPSIGGHWGGPGRDVVGYGPETMQWVFQSVFPLKLRQVTSEVWLWDRAHDIYLDCLIDAGLLGLLALIAAFVLFFRRAFGALRGAGGPSAWMLIASVSALAGYLVDGVFAVEISVTLLILWLILAFGVTVSSQGQDEIPVASLGSQSMRTTLWFWPALILVVALFALIPGVDEQPGLLAGLWLLAGLIGIAAVALAVYPHAASARSATPPAGQDRSRSTASAGRRKVAGFAACVGLVTALVLAGQLQNQRAAFAQRLGLANVQQGQTADGIRYLQDSATAAEFEPDYERDLGRLYAQLGSSISASAASTASASGRLDPRSVDPDRAVTLDRNQLFQLGASSMDRARSLSPLSPDVYDDLGTLYLAWNRPVQALNEFRHAAALSVNNPRYLDEEAQAELQAGRSREAVALGRQAVALDPTFWYSHYTLAHVYHQVRDRSAARQEASAGLLWAPIVWPPPPQSQLAELRKIARSG